jgi:NAD(P)H-dependent FMN reductase
LLAASPGPYGGVRHLPHLRQSLGGLGVTVIGLQVALIRAAEAFDEAGALKDPQVAKSVQSLAKAVVEMAGKLK